MESKDLLNVCRQAGLDVKNQLSTLDPEQRDMVELMVRKGQSAPVATAVAPPPLHAPPAKIRNLDKRPAPTIPRIAREPEAAATTEPPAPAPTPPAVVPPSPEKPSKTVAPATLTPPAAKTPVAPPRPAEQPPAPRIHETPAARKTVPKDLYEAIAIDGGGPWIAFWYVTLPFLRTTILSTAILLSLLFLNMVTMIFIMTGGGPLHATETLAVRVFKDGFVFLRTGVASTLSVLIVLLNLGFSVAYVTLLKSRQGAVS